MINGDELVAVLSVKQKVSWQTFNNYFQTLVSRQVIDVSRDKHLKTNVVRALDSLSFCDFAFENASSSGSVYACSPALVRLPRATPAEFLMVGARTPKSTDQFIHCLTGYGLHPSVTTQPYTLVPARISIEGDVEVIEEVCKELDIALKTQPPSWQILCFAPSVSDYVRQCSFLSLLESEVSYEDFDFQSLQFSKSVSRSDEHYRLTTYYAEYGRPRHYLWRQGRCAVVDRDWGRYVVLSDRKKNILTYDQVSSTLLVPILAPLPRLHSRSMALCSGIAPDVISLESKNGLLVYQYRDVPELFAEMLARKLDQKLDIVRGTK